MPELPEVETIRRTLRPLVVGAEIMQARFNDPRALPRMDVNTASTIITGKRIAEVSRRGKYLIIVLDHALQVVIHLRMTGRLFVLPQGEEPPNLRVSAWFSLSNGQCLFFVDTRRFGTIDIGTEEELRGVKGLIQLGPDPTQARWTVEILAKAIGERKAPIKSLLLNQSVVAGLGNIYADESLFCAGVHPLRPGNSLKRRELERLTECIRRILLEATEFQGTTFRDFQWGYRQTGSFQNYLQVYGRQGKPCRKCETPLETLKVAGRTTVFCAHCQPKQESTP